MVLVANSPLLDISHTTGMMEMLVCLRVVDEQFSVLAIPTRLVARNPDEGPDGFGLVEDSVHFFEGAVCGFWVEEVDDGEDEGVTVTIISIHHS